MKFYYYCLFIYLLIIILILKFYFEKIIFKFIKFNKKKLYKITIIKI